MMLVIYIAHFARQYQIVIISNSWKLFLLLLRSSPRSASICAALPSSVSVHIYCECKWVSRKIMCNKILFPLNSKSSLKRNVFSREFERKRWCTRLRLKGRQRILRIIRLAHSHNFYCQNLHFYCDDFWLIISARCNQRVQLFSMRILAFRSIISIFSRLGVSLSRETQQRWTLMRLWVRCNETSCFSGDWLAG